MPATDRRQGACPHAIRIVVGTFTARVTLPDRTALDALVDTGATFSKIPARILRRLKVRPDFSTRVELGDGRRIRRNVGYLRVAVGAKRALVPVIFAKDREEPLLGATTLEILGLAPDPLRRTLVESRHLELGTPGRSPQMRRRRPLL